MLYSWLSWISDEAILLFIHHEAELDIPIPKLEHFKLPLDLNMVILFLLALTGKIISSWIYWFLPKRRMYSESRISRNFKDKIKTFRYLGVRDYCSSRRKKENSYDYFQEFDSWYSEQWLSRFTGHQFIIFESSILILLTLLLGCISYLEYYNREFITAGDY